MEIENGGQNAKRGHNYEVSVTVEIIIRNFNKPNFELIPEGDDDIEVIIGDDYHAYIQCKTTQDLSLSKLLYEQSSKPSILKKNLSHGDDKSISKLVTIKLIPSDFKEMTLGDDELFKESYYFSKEQLINISKKTGIKNVENVRVYFTNYEKNSRDSEKYLIKLISDLKLIDSDDTKNLLLEIIRLVTQKGELDNNAQNREEKTINGEDIQKLVEEKKSFTNFFKVLDELTSDEYTRKRIRISRNKLELYENIFFEEVKEVIKKTIDDETEINIVIREVFAKCIGKIEWKGRDKYEIYAILISAYCSLVFEK